MTGHIFISYSHRHDGAYVQRLAARLAAEGFPVWYDKEVVHGERWAAVIREKIHTWAAFIVVMTPDAEQSQWVQKEIAEATDLHKPILPLLLGGRRFFTLADIQYDDVSDGDMPSPTFIARLRALVPTVVPPHATAPGYI